MRLVVLFCILLTNFNCLSQPVLKRTVSGSVSASDNGEPIKNAIIVLKSSSGAILECKTDSAGYYSFEILNDSTSLIELICLTDKSTNSKTKSFCGWLAGKERHQFSLTQSRITDKNFTLTRLVNCGVFPKFYFFKNSDVISNDTNNNGINDPDKLPSAEVLKMYVDLLKENPQLYIEIGGYASYDEKNADELCLRRAQYVKKRLVEKGVNEKRILTTGKGYPTLVTTDRINSAKQASTKEEKELLYAKDRYTTFRIVSWDFKE